MTLRLVENIDPVAAGNTLHVEPAEDDDQVAFLVICETGGDPVHADAAIVLGRTQVESLRDYLNDLLSTRV